MYIGVVTSLRRNNQHTRLVYRIEYLATNEKRLVRLQHCVPYAELAQLGEHNPYKFGVSGSRPLLRTTPM